MPAFLLLSTIRTLVNLRPFPAGGRRRGPTPAAVRGLAFPLIFLAGWSVGCGPDPSALPPESASEDVLGPLPEARPLDGLFENDRLLEVEAARNPVDLPALQAFLEDPDPSVRARAAFVVGSIREQPEGIRAALLGRLEDPAASVRRDAAFALGRRGGLPAGHDPEVEESLLGLLDDGEGEVRRAALEALGFRGGTRAVEALLAFATASASPGSHAVSRTRALARLAIRTSAGADTPVVQSLMTALGSTDPEVVEAAAIYFAETPDPQGWAAEQETVVRTLERADLADGTVLLLCQALASQRNPAARDHLLRFLVEAERDALRLGAARGLNSIAFIESAGVREALFRAVLEDPLDAVAQAAAGGLSRGLRIPGWVQEEALSVLARPDVPHDRQAAFLGLLAARTSHEPIMAWTRARLADNPGAAAHGIEALGRLPDPPVTPFLLEAAGHPDPWVQEAAALALAGRWERILGPGDELLRYLEIFSRLAAEGTPGAATAAIRSLAHPVFRDREPDRILADARRAREGTPDGAALRHEFSLALRDIGGGGGLPGFAGEGTGDRAPGGLLEGAEGLRTGLRPEGWPEILGPLGASPLLVLETTAGRMAVGLFPEEAPRAVALLVGRARAGLLDGVPFHRVSPGVLAQGGDIVAHDGTGREGFHLPLELTSVAFGPGTLGVAGPDEPGRGLQFFLAGSPATAFDLEHGAPGRLVAGNRVLLGLREGDRIRRACVLRHPGPGTPLPPCDAPSPQGADVPPVDGQRRDWQRNP